VPAARAAAKVKVEGDSTTPVPFPSGLPAVDSHLRDYTFYEAAEEPPLPEPITKRRRVSVRYGL
jgi:hypothetical protein